MRAQGLPSRYWDVTAAAAQALKHRTNSMVVPRPWVSEEAVRTVSAARQRALVTELFERPEALQRSFVLAVGSEPTDELAMVLAAGLMRRARDLRLRPRAVSVRRGPDDVSMSDADLVVLYNLPHDCHQVRAQICRDWLEWFDDSFRVLVVAGGDPYTFCHTRLAFPVDAAIHLRGELREDVQH